MPFKGFKFQGNDYESSDFLKLAINNRVPFPYPFVAWKIDQNNTRLNDQPGIDYVVGPSASSLALCLRKTEIKRKYDYYVDPALAAAEMGSAAHAELDKHTEPKDKGKNFHTFFEFNDLPEPFNRVRFGGTPDFIRIDPDKLEITDFKSKLYIPNGFLNKQFVPDPNHWRQVNIYAWLHMLETGKTLKWARLFYFDGITTYDESKPLVDLETVGRYVKSRLYLWASDASRGLLPERVSEHPGFKDNDMPKKATAGACKYCEVKYICDSV